MNKRLNGERQKNIGADFDPFKHYNIFPNDDTLGFLFFYIDLDFQILELEFEFSCNVKYKIVIENWLSSLRDICLPI